MGKEQNQGERARCKKCGTHMTWEKASGRRPTTLESKLHKPIRARPECRQTRQAHKSRGRALKVYNPCQDALIVCFAT